MASLIDSQRSGSFGLAKLGDGVRANSDAKTQAGLGRGAGEFKKLVNAAWTNTFPAQGATLDLDFANDRGFVRGVGQGRSMDAVTFTRASNGTFVKPDGTLGQHSNQGALGNNLLTFPQNFDNAAWTAGGTTASGNVITTTNGGANQYRYQQLTPVQNVSYTFAIDILKTDGATTFAGIQLVFFTGGTTALGGVTINTNTGVLTDRAGAVPQSKSIVDVGSSWRVTVTVANNTNTIMRADIYPAVNNDGSGTWIISGLTNSITADRAQLELGSTATQYFPTNINTPRFDWASTVQLANKNLVSYSQQIDPSLSTLWTRSNGGIGLTTGQPDYFGGTQATLMTSLVGSGFQYVGNGSANTFGYLGGVPYTFSMFVKAGTATWFALEITDQTTQARGWFNLSTGVKGTTTAGVTSTIETLSGGWYRIAVSYTAVASSVTTNRVRFYISLTDGGGDNNTGTGTTITIFAPQLEQNATVTDYQAIAQPTASTPLLANPTSNGLLIEESRANRILWCRDATQTNWTKTNVTAAKDQTGVDGVASSASSLTASSANGTCIQTITLASGSRTGSVYLKRITGTGTIQVTLDGTTYSTVDLSTTDWRRIVLSGTVTNPTVGIRIVTSGDAVAMDFGQVEDGAFVTSPIMTTTASVTRSADNATIGGIRFIDYYNQGEGTFFIDNKANKGRSGIYNTFNINQNFIHFVNESNGSVTAQINVNGVTFFGFTTQIIASENKKPALTYKADNAGFSANNTTTFVDTSVQLPLLNFLSIGSRGISDNYINGTMNRLIYIPKRISDNALQVLSGQAT